MAEGTLYLVTKELFMPNKDIQEQLLPCPSPSSRIYSGTIYGQILAKLTKEPLCFSIKQRLGHVLTGGRVNGRVRGGAVGDWEGLWVWMYNVNQSNACLVISCG